MLESLHGDEIGDVRNQCICDNAATEVSEGTLRILNEESSYWCWLCRDSESKETLTDLKEFHYPYGGHKLFL